MNATGPDHGMPTRIGLGHLGRDRVAMIEMMLESEGVGHVMVGEDLVVARANEAAARRIIRTIEDREGVEPAWFDPMPERGPSVAGIPVASRVLRIAGWILDVVLLQVVAAMLSLFGASPWTAVGIDALYTVGFVAATGRTLGKLLVGTRVVTVSGRRPGIGAAVVRWCVPSLGLIAGTALTTGDPTDTVDVAAAVLVIGVPVIVYGSVLIGERNRGWHDIVARTCVVHERRRTPRPGDPAR